MTQQEQILADDKMLAEIAKMSAEIANIFAQTIKLNKKNQWYLENQWYSLVVGSAATLAIIAATVAVVNIFV